MKKVAGLFLCVVCFFVFSAYDWGRKSKTQVPVQGTEQTSAVAEAASTAVAPGVYGENVRETYEEVEETIAAIPKTVAQKRASQMKETSPAVTKALPAKTAVTAPAPAANDKAVAIVTLAKIVGSGTPAERKARIESLKRLSEALARSQGAQQRP